MVLRFYGCRVLLLVIKGLISVKQLHAQSKPCGPWRLKTQAMKMSEAILEKKGCGNSNPLRYSAPGTLCLSGTQVVL